MTTNLSPYNPFPLRMSLELFELREGDTCSEVTFADLPTREGDRTCQQIPVSVCSACEGPLCPVHEEICGTCGHSYHESCMAEHLAANPGHESLYEAMAKADKNRDQEARKRGLDELLRTVYVGLGDA